MDNSLQAQAAAAAAVVAEAAAAAVVVVALVRAEVERKKRASAAVMGGWGVRRKGRLRARRNCSVGGYADCLRKSDRESWQRAAICI